MVNEAHGQSTLVLVLDEGCQRQRDLLVADCGRSGRSDRGVT